MSVKSSLYDIHKELGAKFTEFSGFEMPMQYSSIKDEHLTVRKDVGLFDVSHMSNVFIEGKDAEKLLSIATIEDASKINDGMSQYTAILRENGTIIDDTIFLHLGDKFMIMPNAGMSTYVVEWLNKIIIDSNYKANTKDVSKDYVILAVQGPKSRDTLQKLTNYDLNKIGFFACKYIDIAGIECIISHTGYTGELGFELNIPPTENADDLFLEILDAGKDFGIKPIGLGARDSLRLEKCFLLASNEFKNGRTPLEANLSWAINWDHSFIGKDALLKQKDKGNYQRLTYLECIDKGIPRNSCEIYNDEELVGFVSSGGLSPCLEKGIAMGYINRENIENNELLDIMIRKRKVKAKIVKPPFVKKDWMKVN